MQAGVTEESLRRERARFYRQPDHDGRVVLVLGAGNIAAIAPMDVITKMFNEGKVVLVKIKPVNAYLGPYIEEAFAEAIRQKFLAVVYGGADEGRYLVYHRDIDEVHITGSDKTHDNIVWRPPGPEPDTRMQCLWRRNINCGASNRLVPSAWDLLAEFVASSLVQPAHSSLVGSKSFAGANSPCQARL